MNTSTMSSVIDAGTQLPRRVYACIAAIHASETLCCLDTKYAYLGVCMYLGDMLVGVGVCWCV